MQSPGEVLDLPAEQPQPRVPMHRGGPVLQLARVDRRVDLILGQAVLLASRLVAQRRALASPLSIVAGHVRPLSTRGGGLWSGARAPEGRRGAPALRDR